MIHKPLRALTVVYKILLKICYCFMWYFSCMYLCILCACLIPSETEEVGRVKDCCEQPHVYLGPARAAAKLSLSLPTLSVLISASKSICPSSQAPQSLQDREHNQWPQQSHANEDDPDLLRTALWPADPNKRREAWAAYLTAMLGLILWL